MPRRPDLRELTAEVVRRSGGSQVVHLSDPPTASEQLQLLAARLQRRPVAIVPVRCATTENGSAAFVLALGPRLETSLGRVLINLVHVRFAPKATKILRGRESTRCARSRPIRLYSERISWRQPW